MKARALSRLLRAFDRPNDSACRTWNRATDSLGYGRFWLNGGMRLAHRVVYGVFAESVPADRVLDHLCRNASCVNPGHLEVVTQGENVRRGRSGQHRAARTHCPQGHEYSEANTYRHNGRRFCRRCHNQRTPRSKNPVPAVGTARNHFTTITKEH